MGSCYDFNPATDAVEPGEHSIDRWMRMELVTAEGEPLSLARLT